MRVEARSVVLGHVVFAIAVGVISCSTSGAGLTDGGVADASGTDGAAGEFSIDDRGDITLPGSPQGMDVDQQTAKAYVAWWNTSGPSAGLSVIDLKTGQLTATVDLAGDAGPVQPLDVGVNPTTGTVYVSTRAGLLLVDEKTNLVTGSLKTTAAPVALAIDASLNRVYCYEEGTDGTVDVIDGATNALVAAVSTPGFTIPTWSLGSGFLAVSSFKHHVWAVGARAGGVGTGVTEIDGTTNAVVGTTMLAGAPLGAGIDLQNDDLFVSTADNQAPSIRETKGAQTVLVVGCTPGYVQAQVLSGGYTFLFSQPGLAGCADAGTPVTGSVIEACGYDGPQAPACSGPLPVPFVVAPDVVTRIASYFLPNDVVSLLVERGHGAGGATTAPALRWLLLQTPHQ